MQYPLKHHGVANFPITIGISFFSSSIYNEFSSDANLHLLSGFFCIGQGFVGQCSKETTSFILQGIVFISLSRQAATVSSFTSPDSPLTTSCLILFQSLNLWSQPLDALKLLIPKLLTIISASSCSIGPVTAQVSVWQGNTNHTQRYQHLRTMCDATAS